MDDADNFKRNELLTFPDSSRWSRFEPLPQRVLVQEVMLDKRFVDNRDARMVLIVLRRELAARHQLHADGVEIVWSNRDEVGRHRVIIRRQDSAFNLERVEPV